MNPVRDLEQGQSLDPQDPHQRFERLTQSARIHGQGVWLELLRDRIEWNATPEWAQDEAIKAVAIRLGESFHFMKNELYECGGQRHRIAQFEHHATGISFNLLPGGKFTMGCESHDDEQPARCVTLRPFVMGVTPVTRAQWEKIGGTDKRNRRSPNQPIEKVSWNDAQGWLTKAGDRLSLPSEAQWEYACRAGTQSEYCFGDYEANLRDYAWYWANADYETHDVGVLKPNAFGLYDVLGNVFEWCQDTWHDNYLGAPTDGSPWTTGGVASRRVRRGGYWAFGAEGCRSSFRSRQSFSHRESGLGLRLCRPLDEPSK